MTRTAGEQLQAEDSAACALQGGVGMLGYVPLPHRRHCGSERPRSAPRHVRAVSAVGKCFCPRRKPLRPLGVARDAIKSFVTYQTRRLLGGAWLEAVTSSGAWLRSNSGQEPRNFS